MAPYEQSHHAPHADLSKTHSPKPGPTCSSSEQIEVLVVGGERTLLDRSPIRVAIATALARYVQALGEGDRHTLAQFTSRLFTDGDLDQWRGASISNVVDIPLVTDDGGAGAYDLRTADGQRQFRWFMVLRNGNDWRVVADYAQGPTVPRVRCSIN